MHPWDFNALCVPYILGEKTNLSYIVGGRPTLEKLQPGIGYSLRSCRFGTRDRALLVAEIRLCANNHTPTYHVVVGDVVGRENVAMVDQKLDAYCSVELTAQFDPAKELPDEFHWAPRVWPVPSIVK